MKQNEKFPTFSLEGKVITIPYSKSIPTPLSLRLETTASFQLQFYTHCTLSHSSNRIRGWSLLKLHRKTKGQVLLLLFQLPSSHSPSLTACFEKRNERIAYLATVNKNSLPLFCILG